jgi:hypothetical protein
MRQWSARSVKGRRLARASRKRTHARTFLRNRLWLAKKVALDRTAPVMTKSDRKRPPPRSASLLSKMVWSAT